MKRPITHCSICRIFVGAWLVATAIGASAQTQVSTYHNDVARTGLNPCETILTPANVNSNSFGLLFTLPVDGQVYAEPLYMPAITIPGKGTHNVLYVATEHNSIFAFDADSNTGANSAPLWQVNFGPSIPAGETETTEISPEVGITGTPVIANATSFTTVSTQGSSVPVLYVVASVKSLGSNGKPIYTHCLHALNATNGSEMPGSPVAIQGSAAGNGEGSVNGVINFMPAWQKNRAALLFVPAAGKSVNPTVYVAFGSHADGGPYHGWIFGYDAVTLKMVSMFLTTPSGTSSALGYPVDGGGIWQGGAGPASDGTSVYFVTGNGWFDPSTGSYGDSVIRMANRSSTVADFFTPSNQAYLDDYNADLGSAGVLLLPSSVGSAKYPNLIVQAGKEGTIYLINRANLGGYSAVDKVIQELPGATGGVTGSPAYFNGWVYFGGAYSTLMAFPIQPGSATISSASSRSKTEFAYPGPSPSVSSNGPNNGIVWAIQADGYKKSLPAILHAYDATNLANELYNSTMAPQRDTLPAAIKFSVPTIVNGKVYVGATGGVGVFGLLSHH